MFYDSNPYSFQEYFDRQYTGDTARLGCCSMLCLLLVVVFWRFGIPNPELLLRALMHVAQTAHATPELSYMFRKRMYRWQHSVLHASRTNDTEWMKQLFGIVSESQDVACRYCGVFNTNPDGVCHEATIVTGPRLFLEENEKSADSGTHRAGAIQCAGRTGWHFYRTPLPTYRDRLHTKPRHITELSGELPSTLPRHNFYFRSMRCGPPIGEHPSVQTGWRQQTRGMEQKHA